MKLSEAVRGGSEFPDYHGLSIAPNGACCAVGGVFRALGYDTLMDCYTALKQRHVGWDRFSLLAELFPIVNEFPGCPVCETTLWKYHPGFAIECLFEHHKWSKKAIAEWVETIEKKLEAKNAPSPDPVVSEVVEVPPMSAGVPAEAKV